MSKILSSLTNNKVEYFLHISFLLFVPAFSITVFFDIEVVHHCIISNVYVFSLADILTSHIYAFSLATLSLVLLPSRDTVSRFLVTGFGKHN